MTKPLIAIMTCWAFEARATAQRTTWVCDIDPQKFDVRFFVGRSINLLPRMDTIVLDVDDDYKSFPLKVLAMRKWAIDQGYQYVLKVDDDVMIATDRLVQPEPHQHYLGRLRGPSGKYPAPYCSGFAYWLSTEAMQATLSDGWNGDIAEDRWTGNVMYQHGFTPYHEPSYQVVWSKRNAISGRESPLAGNRVIISCEFTPEQLQQVHQNYVQGQRTKYIHKAISTGSLSKVSVMVKTFLRDGYLLACLQGLERNFRDCKYVIVDDGWSTPEKVFKYAELNAMGHSCTVMPFDSGFGAKANRAIEYCDRPYVLIGSDDFDFSDPRVRPGINKMTQVLDHNPSIGVVSGRVDGRPYEFCWAEEPGQLREVRHFYGTANMHDVVFHSCDLTVNYSLVRREVFDVVRWDEDVKIGGGEHAAFFLDVKRAGWRVAVVDGAVIYQFKHNPTWQHKTYGEMRGRARTSGRPCLKRRGVDRYILANGVTELS